MPDPLRDVGRVVRACVGLGITGETVGCSVRGDVGGCVAYQVAGDGPIDLVFIPEWWNETESMWDQPLLADVLERLASFGRLICFDRRGCGISDPIPLGAVPVLDDWLDDLRAVMDAVGSERAVLVGCSGGGPLSVLFAATCPNRVRSLILVNSYARFSRAPDFRIGVPQEIVEWGSNSFVRSGEQANCSTSWRRAWWMTRIFIVGGRGISVTR